MTADYNRYNIKKPIMPRRSRHFDVVNKPTNENTDRRVLDISEIKTGNRYALIIEGSTIRELTGGSFSDRPFKLVDAWIRTGILYDITEQELWYEKKTEVR